MLRAAFSPLGLCLALALLAQGRGAAGGRPGGPRGRPRRSYNHLEGDVRWRRLYSSTHFFLRIDGAGKVEGTRWKEAPSSEYRAPPRWPQFPRGGSEGSSLALQLFLTAGGQGRRLGDPALGPVALATGRSRGVPAALRHRWGNRGAAGTRAMSKEGLGGFGHLRSHLQPGGTQGFGHLPSLSGLVLVGVGAGPLHPSVPLALGLPAGSWGGL